MHIPFARLFITRLVAVALAFVTHASALPITFTFAGAGSGSIDGQAFASADFIITAVGDTTERQATPTALFINAPASITISGVGTFGFLESTYTFINIISNAVGFGVDRDLYSGIAAAFGGWDMLSSLGPVSTGYNLLQWHDKPVLTDGGVLVFESGPVAGTFTAVVSRHPVPEDASTLLLMTLALVSAGVVQVRRRRDG